MTTSQKPSEILSKHAPFRTRTDQEYAEDLERILDTHHASLAAMEKLVTPEMVEFVLASARVWAQNVDAEPDETSRECCKAACKLLASERDRDHWRAKYNQESIDRGDERKLLEDKCDELRTRLAEAKDDNAKLHGELADARSELASLRAKVVPVLTEFAAAWTDRQLIHDVRTLHRFNKAAIKLEESPEVRSLYVPLMRACNPPTGGAS